jgi:hypothetical protein
LFWQWVIMEQFWREYTYVLLGINSFEQPYWLKFGEFGLTSKWALNAKCFLYA